SKGPSTDDRPQRMSICRVAHDWRCVTQARIESTVRGLTPRVEQAAPRAKEALRSGRGGEFENLDIVGLTRAMGIYKRVIAPHKHAVRCPWVSEHSDEDHPDRTDTVVWEAMNQGWPQFFCSHAHCTDRRVIDLIRQYGDVEQFCKRKIV
ncbi:MAG: hypothetical protein ACRC1H_05380, partial [Caldilineaceae bacterium]